MYITTITTFVSSCPILRADVSVLKSALQFPKNHNSGHFLIFRRPWTTKLMVLFVALVVALPVDKCFKDNYTAVSAQDPCEECARRWP